MGVAALIAGFRMTEAGNYLMDLGEDGVDLAAEALGPIAEKLQDKFTSFE